MSRSIILLTSILLTLCLCGSAAAQDDDASISGVPMSPLKTIADGKIYLRTYRGTIVCYDLRKHGPR